MCINIFGIFDKFFIVCVLRIREGNPCHRDQSSAAEESKTIRLKRKSNVKKRGQVFDINNDEVTVRLHDIRIRFVVTKKMS